MLEWFKRKDDKVYDDRGNLIQEGCVDGNHWDVWRRWEYDENNNIIHSRNSYGDTFWYEYDENNRLIYKKQGSSGHEEWYKYNKKGKKIRIISKKEILELKSKSNIPK